MAWQIKLYRHPCLYRYIKYTGIASRCTLSSLLLGRPFQRIFEASLDGPVPSFLSVVPRMQDWSCLTFTLGRSALMDEAICY